MLSIQEILNRIWRSATGAIATQLAPTQERLNGVFNSTDDTINIQGYIGDKTVKEYIDDGLSSKLSLSVIEAAEDIIVGTGAGAVKKLAKGEEGQALVIAGGALAYGSVSGGDFSLNKRVLPESANLTVINGITYITIPPSLDGKSLTSAFFAVDTAPTGASATFQLTNGATAMLSSAAILATTFYIAATVNPANAVVATGDRIRVDCTQIGATVAGAGLQIHLVFA